MALSLPFEARNQFQRFDDLGNVVHRLALTLHQAVFVQQPLSEWGVDRQGGARHVDSVFERQILRDDTALTRNEHPAQDHVRRE